MRYEIERLVVEGLEGEPERAERLRGQLEGALGDVLRGGARDDGPVDAGLLAAGGDDRVLAARVATTIVRAGEGAAR